MEERFTQMEEREALMVQKMEKMFQKMEQMEEREACMVKKMTKMEDEMKMMILLNEKFAQTFDVQTINMQTLSALVCKKNQPDTQTNLDMLEFEQKISDLKTDVDDKYWRLISKNESLAVDVSVLYDRLWLDVEKLIKKTDKNIADIADGDHRVWELTNKFKSTEERVYRVIDQIQRVTEQVAEKAVSDYTAEIMRYGEASNKDGKETL
jgi:hypothetical protein